jgi:hypothetical protein
MIESDITGNNTQFLQVGGDLRIRTIDDSKANPVERLRIDHATGDISFYEDTGTSAGLFWDASTERLGIGTTSPKRHLDVRGGTTDIVANFESSDAGAYIALQDNSTSSDTAVLVGAIGDELRIDTGDTESLRIDLSGKVGIGTSSPATLLNIASIAAPTLRIENTDITLVDGQVIGAVEFYKADDSGAGAGVIGGIQMLSSNSTGAETSLTFGTSKTADGNNIERMRIDSSGNVGIGTNSPAESLHTAGNIRFGDTAPAELYTNSSELRIGVDKNNDNDTSNLTFYTNNDEKVRIDKDGNVGIGTSSPSTNLEVSANGTCNLRLTDSSSPTTFAQLVSANGVLQIKTDGGDAQGNSSMQFFVDTSEAMRIDSSSNVGIGIASPDGNLHVSSGSAGSVTASSDANELVLEAATNVGMTLLTGNSSIARIRFGDADSNARGNIFYNHSNDSLGLQTAASTAMTIDSSGDVGIGTDNPTSLLHLSGASPKLRIDNTEETESGIQFRDSAATGSQLAEILYHAGDQALIFKNGTSAERARIDSSGHFLVATSSSTIDSSNHGILLSSVGRIKNSVDVAGGGAVTHMYGTAGEFRVKGDGDAENTNNAYGAISDERLKENITDATPKLEKLKQVQIKNYNLKAYPDRKQIGVVAQELEQVFPSLVTDNDDGYKTVKYSVFVPMLIKAMQEQQTQIEALQSEINNLKGE